MDSMEPSKESSFFSIDSISKSYDDQKVFSSLSYSFSSNGLYLLLGENGSGKSTLLSILSGKDRDYQGKVSFLGKEIRKKDRESFSVDSISYVPQDTLVFEDEKVLDDFLMPYDKKDKTKAKEILTDLGLGDVLGEKCKELSEGEKERLCFGQAIYADKKIILLDEITANLDSVSAERLRKYILTISKDHLVIFATHDGRPDWLTKDAYILRRKDGSLSEEKEGVLIESSPIQTKTRKHQNHSRFLDSFRTDRKFHWLLIAICTLFTAFSFLFVSVSESTKVVQHLSENGTVTETDPYSDICKQVFVQAASFLPTMDPLPGEEIRYPIVDNTLSATNNIPGKTDFRKPGSLFGGICIYQENDPNKVKLSEGRYPEKQYECIIPDICHKNNPALKTGAEIGSENQYGIFTIVGIYLAENTDIVAAKYKNYDQSNDSLPMDPMARIIYGFKTETIFCGNGTYNNQSRVFLVPNNEKNREAFLAKDPWQFLHLGMYCPICTDKKTGKVLFSHDSFTVEALRLEKIGKLFIYLLPGFLILYLLGYLVANHRKYILLRYLGASRKKLFRDSTIGNLTSSLIGFALGIILGILSIALRNLYYNSHLGTDSLLFFHPYYLTILVSLLTFVAFAILFILSVLFFLLPKNRKTEEIKRK